MKRAASEELGDDDWAITYNQNGRPIRKSAGKRTPDPFFVQKLPKDELSDYIDGMLSSSEDEPEEVKESLVTRRKRRRTPSPSPPPMSPLPPEDVPSGRSSPEPLNLNSVVQCIDLEPINLTFNIALGFSGPLHVKLDLSNLPLRLECSKRGGGDAFPLNTTNKVVSLALDTEKKGFLSLPPELRNKVYRHLFKDGKFDFSSPTNFKRTAAFLRTCRQVYEEGRTILYGENTFYFERNKEMRRPFWAGERKEIGYKDLRLFLHLIGPSNTSYIRHLWLGFDDSMPSATPNLKRNEERRYVHDEHLIACLKVLARQARLKTITLAFWGRKMLARTDARFLENLLQIQADEVEFKSPFTNHYWHPDRIHCDVKTAVKKEMTRKNKLYAE